MKQQPQFDIDLDKHYNATVVIACHECGRETRQHLKTLSPDTKLHCQCGADLTMDMTAVSLAQRRASEIKEAYRLRA